MKNICYLSPESQSGSTSIVLIVSMLLLILSTVLAQCLYLAKNTITNAEIDLFESRYSFISAESTLKTLLTNNTIFSETIKNKANSSFDCIRKKNKCSYTNKKIQKIFIGSKKAVFDPAKNGFLKSGKICLLSALDCKTKLNLFWRPTCTGGCTSPEIEVQVLFTDSFYESINLKKYEKKFVL